MEKATYYIGVYPMAGNGTATTITLLADGKASGAAAVSASLGLALLALLVNVMQ